jgi:hypothetical protein
VLANALAKLRTLTANLFIIKNIRPAGIEPASLVPETSVVSILLRALFEKFLMGEGQLVSVEFQREITVPLIRFAKILLDISFDVSVKRQVRLSAPEDAPFSTIGKCE